MAKEVVRNINININGKEVVNSYAGISKAIRQTNRDITNLNRNDADYVQQLAKHKATLAQLRQEYSQTREEIGRVPKAMNGVRSGFKDMALDIAKGFSIGAVIGKAIFEFNAAKETIIQFDQAQADLAGVMQTTKAGIKGLTEDAKKYGAETSFSASQVSTLQLELAKLGKTEEEIKGMTKGVLDAAVALDAELGPAAELVGGQLNSFGEDASQAQRYADIMANSANISATSFESLATALPKVSAVAAQSNVTFERTNAILAVLSDQNVAAETAGTGFRNILLESAKNGKTYEEMLMKITNSTDATRTATELFGKENATVAVILAKNFDKVEEATKRLENSVGSAAALAETKLDSATGAQKMFSSAWEGMILSFDSGDGVISKTTQSLYGMGTQLIELITPSNQLSKAIFNEQVGLNGLIGEITKANLSNTDRETLLQKLKEVYPDFITFIKDEDYSNQNLVDTLRQVNDNYRDRIALQLQNEEETKMLKERDKVAKMSLVAENNLYDKLQELNVKYNLGLNITRDNLQETANQLQQVGKNNLSVWETGAIEIYQHTLGRLIPTLDKVNKKYSDLVEKNKKATFSALESIPETRRQSLEDERNAEYKAKKDAEEAAKKAAAAAAASGGSGDTDKAAAKKAKKDKELFDRAEKEIDDILQRSREQRELQILDGYAREEAQINQKFAREIEKYATHKKRVAELEAARDAELLANRQKAEAEVAKLTETSQQTIANQKLKGIDREEAQITQKYAKEAEKYKGQTELIKQLETQRDAEINAARALRSEEYRLQTKELEEQNRISDLEEKYDREEEAALSAEERQLILIEKAREVALLEIEIEREKELAKVEAVEGAEELKNQIRQKYAYQEDKIRNEFAKAENALNNKKVDWTKLSEEQKLDAVKSGLNGAAEAFNEGSVAWKAAKIAETTIATYQSATASYNAFASMGGPWGVALGIAAAAAAVVSGVKNIQKISNTKLEKMPTYYHGGYTGNQANGMGGDEYGQFTGLTHANEWVAPAFMAQSPRYAPIIDWLDNERQMQLNGGSGSAGNPMFDNPVFSMLAGAVMHLNEALENGIVAKSFFGYEEVEKMEKLQKELQQTKNNAIISK